MFVVIVSSWIKRIEQIVVELPGVYEVKLKGPRLFLYVDKDESYNQVANWLKKYIRHYLTGIIVFEVYGMFQGKIDMLDYLPVEMKLENKYYKSTKEITPEEEDAFFAAHPEINRKS